MIEKKTLFREYFPGYMGHIPMKNEVIGMTVGATNSHIKASLNKEPDYEETFVPSTKPDYTYYNKAYFNENMSKNYPLEEDKIFSNRSKEARSWICGPKHQLYPEHIPGYTGHVHGIEITTNKGSGIFGTSYAKATGIAVKGVYNNKMDVPKEDKYISEMKDKYVTPKRRSNEEEQELQRAKEMKEQIEEEKTPAQQTQNDDLYKGMSDAFKQAIGLNRKPVKDMPYVVGYGGFRPGVYAGNCYGKNFKEISLNTINERKSKEHTWK